MPTTPSTTVVLFTNNPSLKLVHPEMTSAFLTVDTINNVQGIQPDGSAVWDLSSLGTIQHHIGQVSAIISGQPYIMPLDITISLPPHVVYPLENALKNYRVIPQFPPNTIPDPGVLYWGVKAQLRDITGTVISESPESPLQQFLVDAQETGLIPNFGGPGGTTWAPLLQKDPLVPAKIFRLLSVIPYPGYINQDSMPQSE